MFNLIRIELGIYFQYLLLISFQKSFRDKFYIKTSPITGEHYLKFD
jgi:uncharacterized membrane protein (DUF485 family)